MSVEILKNDNKMTLNLVAIRPFRINGEEKKIGDKVPGVPKAEAMHIIASGKALEDLPQNQPQVDQAKAAAKAKADASPAPTSAPGRPVDVKAIVDQAVKIVREQLAEEMEKEIEGLKATMADEIKKQVEDAIKAAKK